MQTVDKFNPNCEDVDGLIDTYLGSDYDIVKKVADNIEIITKVANSLGSDTDSLIESILKQIGHNIIGSFENGCTITELGQYVTYQTEVYHYKSYVLPYIIAPGDKPNADFALGYRGSVKDWNAFDSVLLEYAALPQSSGFPDTQYESLRLDALRKLGLPMAWKQGKEITQLGTLVRWQDKNYTTIKVPVVMGETPDEEHFKNTTVNPDDVVPDVAEVVKQYKEAAELAQTIATQQAANASLSSKQASADRVLAEDAADSAKIAQDSAEGFKDAAHTSATNARESEVKVEEDKNTVTVLATEVTDLSNDVKTRHQDVVVKHGEIKNIYADFTVTMETLGDQVSQANTAALKAEEARDRAEDFATRSGLSATEASNSAIQSEQSKVTSVINATNALNSATSADGFRQQAGNYALTAEGSMEAAAVSATNAKADADRAALEVGKIGSAVSDATSAANNATAAATRAETAANTAESAKADVEDNANKAEASAVNAKSSEDSARNSATAAEAAKSEVLISVTQATNAATESKAAAATTENNAVRAETAQNAAIASATNASNSATSAKTSETASLGYRDKCQEIYDGIKGGVAVLGTWDASSGAFPTKHTTSARWDVIVSTGTEAVVGGFTWHNGDTLYYDKATDEFTQTKGSASVTSVNGRTGAVVLTAEDIGAVKKTGDIMTGRLILSTGVVDDALQLRASSNPNQETIYQSFYNSAASARWGYDGFPTNRSTTWVRKNERGDGIAFSTRNTNAYQGFTFNGKKIYNEGFKPTWADVGGNNYIGSSTLGGGWIEPKQNVLIDHNKCSIFKPANISSKQIMLGDKASLWKEVWADSYRGGGVNVTGSITAGSSINLGSACQLGKDGTGYYIRNAEAPDSGYRALVLGDNGIPYFYSATNGNKAIFHEGRKPTWNDVGGDGYWKQTSNGSTLLVQPHSRWVSCQPNWGFLPSSPKTGSAATDYIGTQSWWFKEAYVNTYRGNAMNITGDVSARHLFASGSIHGNEIGVPLNQHIIFNKNNAGIGWGITEESSSGALRFKTRSGTGGWTSNAHFTTDGQLYVKGNNPVYHAGHKPTLDILTGTARAALESSTLNGKSAAQIINEARSGLVTTANVYTKTEADNRFLGKTGGSLTGGLTTTGLGRTTYSETRLPTYDRGSETYLRKFRGGNGDTIWHETVQGGDVRWWTGNSPSALQMELKSGGQLYLGSAKNQVYHKGYKPTPADVGALPSSGGVLTGKLELRASSGIEFVPRDTTGNMARGITYYSSAQTPLAFSGAQWTGASDNLTNFFFGEYKLSTQSPWAYNSTDCWLSIAKGGQLHTEGKRIYHEGFKPTWGDVGGNSWFVEDGTYPRYAKNTWLRANGSADAIEGGFLPYKNGSSYLGTDGWKFNQSHIQNMYTTNIYTLDPRTNKSRLYRIWDGGATRGSVMEWQLPDGNNDRYGMYLQAGGSEGTKLEVNGNIKSIGSIYTTVDLKLTKDARRHIVFANANDTRADAYIYCDTGAGSLAFNRGDRNGSTFELHDECLLGAVIGRSSYQGGIFRTSGDPSNGVHGGSWAAWQNRNAAYGMDVHPTNIKSSAYSILKATAWGFGHLFALDVHCPNNDPGAGMQTRIQSGNGSFWFYGHGAANAISWVSTSDEAVKENIRPLVLGKTSALDMCKSFEAKRYTCKVNNTESIGFVAQDVEKVLPEVVAQDINNPLNPDGENIKGLDYGRITALHHEAIKELEAKNKELEAKIARLEALIYRM